MQSGLGEDPVPLESYVWADLVADGVTATAQAIDLLTEQLEYNKMQAHGRNQYPPLYSNIRWFLY